MSKRAVLLVNLGSPDSTSVPDVRRYLREFLGDERVLDLPAPFRWLLLEGIILRTRPKKSAHAYEEIWTKDGSPLVLTSKRVAAKLAEQLGSTAPVYLAMRYGSPSIASVIAQMAKDGVTEVLLFPQYPHYAMSSWETVVVKVFRGGHACWLHKIKFTTVQPFYADADYIDALYQVSAPYFAQPHDLHSVLVPRHPGAASAQGRLLQRPTAPSFPDCCTTCSPVHSHLLQGAVPGHDPRARATRIAIAAERHSISFQSRLAGEPWLTPYTDFELKRLPQEGTQSG
jgi:ferrochelatase